MMLGLALLAVAGATVLAAILVNRQTALLLGVVLYAGVTLWLAQAYAVLVLPALVCAIGLELVGLRRVLHGGCGLPPDTSHHNSARLVEDEMRPADGI